MQLEWREELVGNPETGVLAGGPLTAMIDSCCGMSVATMLKEPKPFATLDLRIDYVRPATPGKAVIAEAECYRITRSVAFTRAFAHHGDPKDPDRRRRRHLHAGHQGRGDAAAVDRHGGQVMSAAIRCSSGWPRCASRATSRKLAEAIPYARWMRIAPENGTGELLTRMRYHDDLIGNTFLPAIHGGTLGAMLEMAAIFHLLWETETETVPKIVNITVDYLRSARPVDVIACAKVTKQGRRMVNVFAEAWQDDRSKPVATANAHFLVKSDDAPPSL